MAIVIEPKINGALLDIYCAKMLDYSVSPVDYDDGYLLPASSMTPVKLKPKIGLRTITITLDFEGDTRHEIEMNISKVATVLQDGAELSLPDGFLYTCVYEKSSNPTEKAPWIMQVKYTLSGFRHGEMHIETLTKTADIYVEGNYPAEAIYRISGASGSVTVNGITVKNISGEVVIDGMKKTVTQNGINKFGDTDMTSFPKLNIGQQTVQITGTATVEVSYYPIYR